MNISLFQDLIKGHEKFLDGKTFIPGWQPWPRHKGRHAEDQQA